MGGNVVIVLYSYHHHNTEKIARVIAPVLGAEIKRPSDVRPECLVEYDLVGFGSGVYSSTYHKSLIRLANKLPQVSDKETFLFSTCGAPAFAVDKGHVAEYRVKVHATIRNILESKGFKIVDDFMCPGWNTNSFLKLFGGINKGRPNADDCAKAVAFAQKIQKGI